MRAELEHLLKNSSILSPEDVERGYVLTGRELLLVNRRARWAGMWTCLALIYLLMPFVWAFRFFTGL